MVQIVALTLHFPDITCIFAAVNLQTNFGGASPPPPSGPIFLIFMQFSGSLSQIIGLGWRPLWEILDPPLL